MQAHVLVLGFVQGVGFRRFVKSKAKKLNLTGWVKNLSDGRVEARVSGEKEVIEELIKQIKKGSFFAEVKDILVNWEDSSEEFGEFSIIR